MSVKINHKIDYEALTGKKEPERKENATNVQPVIPVDQKENATNVQPTIPSYQAVGTYNDAVFTPEERAEKAADIQEYNRLMSIGDTAGANALHDKWENLRINKYGYSGGADGSEYIKVNKPQTDAVSSLGNLSGSINNYSNYINDMYAAKKAAALAALENAYQQNVNAIDRAGAGLDKAYQDARNKTAGASDLAKRNFAQYAAANGLNSGAGGQVELARNVALLNSLNGINMQEAQSVADLELQKANAEVEYNNAIARAEAEGNYELAAALYQEKVRVDNAMTAAIQQEFQNNLAMMQFNAQQDQQKWENQFAYNQLDAQTAQSKNKALADYGAAFLNAGVIPSAEMLAAMNMSAADAQRFISALRSEVAIDTPDPAPTQTDLMSLANRFYQQSGDPDYVYRLLRYNNFSDAEIDAAMAALGL